MKSSFYLYLERSFMKKKIKIGKNIGIAEQVQGKIVDIQSHQRFKGLWQYEFNGEKWIASDYAFEKEDE